MTTGQTLLWNAVNEGVLQRARERYDDLSHPAGPGEMPPRLSDLVKRVGEALQAGQAGQGKRPPPEVVTLAVFDNPEESLKKVLKKAAWYFRVYFLLSAALAFLFLGAGIATILGAVFQKIDMWGILAGAGASITGAVGVFFWTPLDKLREAVAADMRLTLAVPIYLARVQACKVRHNLETPEGMDAAIDEVARATDEFMANLERPPLPA